MGTEEYENQYFGFGRQYLKSSLKSLVETRMEELIKKAESFYASSSIADETLKKDISVKCAKLLEFCTKKSNVHLREIDRIIDENFSIPENVILPEDEQFTDVDSEAVILLKNETDRMKARILALDSLETVLERELSKVDALQYVFDEEKTVSLVLDSLQQHSIVYKADFSFHDRENI